MRVVQAQRKVSIRSDKHRFAFGTCSTAPPVLDSVKIARNAVSGTVSCGSKGASAQGVVLACQTANGGTEHGNGTDKLSASPKQSSRRTRRHMNLSLSKEVLIIPESKEAATSTAAEKVTVLTTVRTWMAVREQGDAERAAELSTEDIVVRTPLGAVRGLENGARLQATLRMARECAAVLL